nr:RNA degradosome polyphosphate kinase [Spirochaetota bacterium]
MKKNDNFFNREINWLEFNYRVLEEALDKTNPLLERLKFLSIFSNNLDEFIMVRAAGLVSQVKSGYPIRDDSGLTAEEALDKIEKRLKELVDIQYEHFNKELFPALKKEGFEFYDIKTLPDKYKQSLRELFLKKYFLMLTPMAIDQSHPFPFLAGKTLNLLLKLEDPKKSERLFAVIPYPSKERFIQIPDDETGQKFIFVGELIKLFAGFFFKGYKILNSSIFRITRDAELSIDEGSTEDLLSAIEDELKRREKGEVIRLEVEGDIDEDLLELLKVNTPHYKGFCFKIDGTVDLSSFSQIAFMKGFDHLKDTPLVPILPLEFSDPEVNIFDLISKKDRLLNLPFESFDPVVKFIETAAEDPKVLAIKQT